MNVSEKKLSVSDFMQEAKSNIENGWFVAALTDELIIDDFSKIDSWEIIEKEKKVLEIRCFNKDKELKLFRSDIGKDFRHRIKDDKDLNEKTLNEKTFDEIQLIDIDLKKTEQLNKKGYVVSTGGGVYPLPIPIEKQAGASVRVRYYLDDKAGVNDWRIVELKGGK